MQKGVYFQNAIQQGDLWCDLANDTVDITRPAAEFLPMAEARFEELESFEHFTRVVACYWGMEVYPTHCLPAIAAERQARERLSEEGYVGRFFDMVRCTSIMLAG